MSSYERAKRWRDAKEARDTAQARRIIEEGITPIAEIYPIPDAVFNDVIDNITLSVTSPPLVK